MFREKAQIAALALLMTGGAAVGAHANKENRLEPIPPLPPPPPTEIMINDEEAGLSCVISPGKLQSSDTVYCQFSRIGNPYLSFSALKEDLIDKDGEVLFLLAGTAIPSLKIGGEVNDEVFGIQINEKFGIELNMDIHYIGYEIDQADGGYTVGQFAIKDGRMDMFAGELFELESVPRTVKVSNNDGVEIGKRNVSGSIDILIKNHPEVFAEEAQTT